MSGGRSDLSPGSSGAKRSIVKCISSAEQLDVARFNRLGLGVEIQDFTEPNLSFGEQEEIAGRYRRLFEGFKGIKSLHGPFLDLKPASPDPLIRAVSYERYRRALQIAAALETDFIIFHSQINPFLNEPALRDRNNRQAGAFWERILEETEYRGTILIENIFEKDADLLKRYLRTVNRPNMKANLDLGHLKARGAGLEEWLGELKDDLVYMHIHSNDGRYDLHRRPTTQEIAHLYSLLDRYRLNPVLALEYPFDHLEAELARYR